LARKVSEFDGHELGHCILVAHVAASDVQTPPSIVTYELLRHALRCQAHGSGCPATEPLLFPFFLSLLTLISSVFVASFAKNC